MPYTPPNESTFTSLNQPYVSKGWYPLGFVDQFIRKVRFEKLEKPTTTVSFNRASESLAPTANFAVDGPMANTSTNVSQQSVTLKRIGDIVVIDQLSVDTFGNVNDILEHQIESRKIGIVRTLGQQIMAGSGAGAQLTGLSTMLTLGSNQYIAVAGGLPTFVNLQQLVYTVRASDGCVGSGADCIVTNEQVIRYFLYLQQNFNDSTRIEYKIDPDLGVPVPHFLGVPIYIGQVDSVSPDIWAMKLNGPTGIRVVHATGSSNEFGIEVKPMPVQQSAANVGAFVGGMYGLLVPEPHSIARLAGSSSATMATNAPALGNL